jgi:simple sugar transport system permease protein
VRRYLADLLWYGGAILGGLLVVAVVLALLGADPLAAYAAILLSSLGSLAGVGQTLNKASPLLLGALAVTLGMRGGYLNIGVDGQIYLGAALGTGLALWWGPALPGIAMIPLVLLGGLTGGLLAVLPAALLRAFWNVNEIFVTVMLNFVFAYLVEYLSTGPWNDPTAGEAITRSIPASAVLPAVLPGRAHLGLLLGLLLAAGVAWVLRNTVLGFEIRAAGENRVAARVGGINLAAICLITLCASGALAGLAGAMEVTGYYHRLILGLTPNYGLMAILIAVAGRRTILGAILGAFAFAILLVGSDSLQRSVHLPASSALLFQSAILLSVLLAEAVRARRLRGLRGLIARRPVPEATA